MITNSATPAVSQRAHRPELRIHPPKSPEPASPDRLPVRRGSGTRSGWPTIAALLVADVLALAVAIGTSRLAWNRLTDADWLTFSPAQWQLAMLFAGIHMALAATHGMYSPIQRPAAETRKWILMVLMGTAVVVGTLQFGSSLTASEIAWLLSAGALALLLLPLYRAACRMACGNQRWWGVRVIVVGSGGLAARAFAHLLRRPQDGLRPVGFVDDGEIAASAVDPELFLGPLDALPEIARRLRVNRAVVGAPAFDAEEIATLISRSNSGIEHWIVLPALAQFPSLWTTATEAAGMPGLAVTNRLAAPWAAPMKRALDLLVTLSLGFLSLPVFALLAALVRLSSPGPVFYSQERIGLHGRRFRAWKFRTMLPDADSVLERHLAEDPALLAEWQATHKLKCDPRVTWIGYWLRKSSLDELPQVWNVLRGDMSLVGPRPIVEAEIDKYADHYAQYVQVMPGITGLWQISGRNNTTYDERVDYDAYYIRNWSPWLDLYILGCTVKVVLLREGAY